MLHREIRQHDFFRRWFVAPLLPIGLRPSVSRLSPGIAVGHVATARAPPTKIGLVRQVIGIIAGVSLSERRVPRRRIIALRHRARGKCSGQSSSQKKLFHNRLRDFRFAQELRTRGWKFAFLSPSMRRGGFPVYEPSFEVCSRGFKGFGPFGRRRSRTWEGNAQNGEAVKPSGCVTS